MITVGLTGCIATGKSTVSEMLRELGAYIIDYDILAREVVEPYRSAWNGIVDAFGEIVLYEDLTLNREKLAEIVFDDTEKLQCLNQITHPAVFDTVAVRVEGIAGEYPDALVIHDVPLLIETGVYKNVSKVILVAASPENQLERLLGKGFTEEDALKRMGSQMPIAQKKEYADYVIDNDGTFEETRKQVNEVFDSINQL